MRGSYDVRLARRLPGARRRRRRAALRAGARHAIVPGTGPGVQRRTSSCTRTPRTRSSTARRCPRSSPRAPPSSATTRSRSPTTTASTARSSSRTRRSTSASARSPAPRSRSTGGDRTSRLLCETQRGYANLCRILTDAHAGTRLPGRETRAAAGRRRRSTSLAAHAEGLVCLSGCARHGLGVARPERRRPARARVRGRVLRRAAAAVRARRRAPQRRARRARRDARRPDRRDRRRARAPPAPRAPPGRARRDPQPHLARRLRARAPRQPRVASCSPPARDARAPAARRGAAHARDRRPLPVRPDAGARLPLPRLLRRPRPGRRRSCGRSATARSPIATERANGHKRRARERLDDELALIARLGLAGFFLLHWEVLELARECALEVRGPGSPRHALPPGRGRGSSVGSIVCYLTGLSHVDPVEAKLSLGRFINDEMVAVPDIDLDFPRDIREKLIVRVTERYGREHAALVASFATYRSRGAIRDVGKALGLPFAELERLARVTDGWDATRIGEELDGVPGPHTGPRWEAFRELTREIAGLPRHISQHPGGMVISTRPLIDLVPVQPAAMAGRQICQWDKDSCGDAGLPEDRPARARDALRGRGGDRPDRAPARRDDRPLAHPARRPGGLRRDPGCRHRRRLPDREPRADAEPAADAARRTSTTSPCRSRSSGRGRSRARPSTRTSSTASAPARGSDVRAAGRARVAARAAARHARRRRLPGSGARRVDGGGGVQRWARPRGCAAR